MRDMTLCFLVKENSVLLGLKKRGFGAGRFMGIGGKVEAGERVETAARRELAEEITVYLPESALQPMGCIQFLFPARPDWNQSVHIFRAARWQGDPSESDEIKPVWFEIGRIPYGDMWQDAPYWLPCVLEGRQLAAKITFQSDNESVADAEIEMRPVHDLEELSDD